jgi:hypothetical protein
MHATSRGRHNAHALRPQIGEIGEAPLSELARSLCGPDDVPLEIDDLAAHFLLEATQAAPSSLPPVRETARLESEALEASLGEACFEDEDGRAGQRSFERLWHEIISRELATRSR